MFSLYVMLTQGKKREAEREKKKNVRLRRKKKSSVDQTRAREKKRKKKSNTEGPQMDTLNKIQKLPGRTLNGVILSGQSLKIAEQVNYDKIFGLLLLSTCQLLISTTTTLPNSRTLVSLTNTRT